MQMLVKKIFFIFISLSFFSSCTNQNSPIAEANNPPIIERFYLASENVYIGESVEISWETTYTSYCVASGDWNGQKASNGSELIDINEHKTYFFSLEYFGEKQNSSKIAEIEFQAKYQGIYLEPYLLSYFPDKEISEDLKRSIFKKFSRLSKVSDVRSLYFINSKL